MNGKPIETFCLVLALLLIGQYTVLAQQQSPSSENQDLQYRTWVDSMARFSTEAAMVKFSGGKVHLLKRDGKVVAVSVGALCKGDQLYVREELARRAAGRETQPTTPPTTAAKAAGWPGWRGARRDGKSPDRGLLKQWPPEGPRLLWQVDSVGKGFSTVAVTGDTVYTSGDVGDTMTIFAFDHDGQLRWRTAHDSAWTKSHPGARSTPMIDGGNLYIVSGNGQVGCYDAKTGRPKWTQQLRQFGGSVPGWGYAESVLIHGNLAIVTPGGQNCIVALDKTTGRTVWSSQGFKAGAQYGSCYAFAYKGMPMVVTGTGEGLVCVDPDNGRPLWSNPFSAHNTANCPTPVFSDGYVFWANGYGKGGICMQLDVSGQQVSAREAWKTNDMVCHHGGYIVHEGHIYGNHSNGWVCLDLKTGRKLWEERAVGKGSLCFADGMLYLFGESGGNAGLATCSPQGMEKRGSFSVAGSGPSWAHPVVIDGRLYLRFDRNLYCFDVRAGK